MTKDKHYICVSLVYNLYCWSKRVELSSPKSYSSSIQNGWFILTTEQVSICISFRLWIGLYICKT